MNWTFCQRRLLLIFQAAYKILVRENMEIFKAYDNFMILSLTPTC